LNAPFFQGQKRAFFAGQRSGDKASFLGVMPRGQTRL